MPTATQDDPVLSNLSSWQSKHDAVQLIIDNPSSTGEALVKAEKLFDEGDRIGEQIQDRQHKLQSVQNLKDRYSAGDSWSREPQRTLPFSSEMGGRSKQYGTDGAALATSGSQAGSPLATVSCNTTLNASSSRW